MHEPEGHQERPDAGDAAIGQGQAGAEKQAPGGQGLTGGDISIQRRPSGGEGESRLESVVPGTGTGEVPGSTYSGSIFGDPTSPRIETEDAERAYLEAYRECMRRLGY